jgi:hypothetical protein
LLGATDLALLLDDHDPLRLVFLNSCEGAKGSPRDTFSSTASTLVRSGIPAVVAMQYEITDKAAIDFSRAFYEALADGLPVDVAVVEARTAVKMTSALEWGTPVLYMRSTGGRIFDLQEDPARAYREDVEAVWENSTLNEGEVQWLGERASSVGLNPTFRTHKRAQAQLLVAACNVLLQYLGICGLSERTLRSAPSTRAPYRRITASPKVAPHPSQKRAFVVIEHPLLQVNHPQRSRREENTREPGKGCGMWVNPSTAANIERGIMGGTKEAILERQGKLSELYARARQLRQDQKWRAVVAVFDEIRALDPAYSDPEGLLVSAHEALADLPELPPPPAT